MTMSRQGSKRAAIKRAKTTKLSTESMVDALFPKPKRALTAFNLFTIWYRDLIVQSKNVLTTRASAEDVLRISIKHKTSKPRRQHRKTPGLFGFHELSKVIAECWKNLPDDMKKPFEQQASNEKLERELKLAAWSESRRMAMAIIESGQYHAIQAEVVAASQLAHSDDSSAEVNVEVAAASTPSISTRAFPHDSADGSNFFRQPEAVHANAESFQYTTSSSYQTNSTLHGVQQGSDKRVKVHEASISIAERVAALGSTSPRLQQIPIASAAHPRTTHSHEPFDNDVLNSAEGKALLLDIARLQVHQTLHPPVARDVGMEYEQEIESEEAIPDPDPLPDHAGFQRILGTTSSHQPNRRPSMKPSLSAPSLFASAERCQEADEGSVHEADLEPLPFNSDHGCNANYFSS